LIAQYPDWGTAYTNLARALADLNRHAEALQAAREGVRKAPRTIPGAIPSSVRCLKAWAAMRRRLPPPRKRFGSSPTCSFAFCLLSYNYDQLRRYSNALDATATGLKHDPHDQELLRLHAFNLYRRQPAE